MIENKTMKYIEILLNPSHSYFTIKTGKGIKFYNDDLILATKTYTIIIDLCRIDDRFGILPSLAFNPYGG